MNEFESLSDSQLDRLVDDELSTAERREVLLALERESDGWRRLALAFVESQTFRRDFRSLAKSQAPELTVRLREPVDTPRKRLDWHAAVAVAICSLMTFGLGRWSSSTSIVDIPHGSQQVPAPQTYQSSTAEEESQQMLMGQSETSDVEQQRTMRLQLEGQNPGEVQTIDVPVVEQANLQPEDLLKAPLVISEAMKRELLQSGRRVHEQRQIYEVQLDDGRCAIVPISELRLENTGWDGFQ